jgi:hypothetical protein
MNKEIQNQNKETNTNIEVVANNESKKICNYNQIITKTKTGNCSFVILNFRLSTTSITLISISLFLDLSFFYPYHILLF